MTKLFDGEAPYDDPRLEIDRLNDRLTEARRERDEARAQRRSSDRDAMEALARAERLVEVLRTADTDEALERYQEKYQAGFRDAIEIARAALADTTEPEQDREALHAAEDERLAYLDAQAAALATDTHQPEEKP